ncbi:hypothetical protein [Amycolatopsis rifamycinica]|uniref:Uncharacterized protein n=1 Tax=Amycolatopsis rifamycinica TaxID=287986 RepID=A0A066U367_9PSEU|nr:hypothetical protein [Amycolatopsis rifamycinica]KDN21901.1 hypothetical protein DV20_13370 [Amycolatopsis rifamycinica]
MKKAYVYGMAGLVTAAVGVTAASGLWDGAESDAGEQHVPAALASTAVTPNAAPTATPAPAAVQVAPAAPVAAPGPVVKVAKPEARAAAHQQHKKPVKKANRPRPSVVHAAVVKNHVTPPVKPIAQPVKPIAVAVPNADPVVSARQSLDNASKAVKDARRLLDTASADVKHARSELKKVKQCDGKHRPQAKKTTRVKDRPVAAGQTTSGSSVSVSLDSSQVKPGQSKTITKSTSDGSAWSSVTVTRK